MSSLPSSRATVSRTSSRSRIQARTTVRYGVLSLPTTFFIDATGVIRHIRIGGPMSAEEIAEGLAKARGAN